MSNQHSPLCREWSGVVTSLLLGSDVISGEADSLAFGPNIPINDFDTDVEEVTVKCGLMR